MTEWKLHVPSEENLVTHYKCGLIAGQRVRLKKEIVVSDCEGNLTGEVYPIGEVWVVLAGIKSDPVLWFRQADGVCHTWDDDVCSVNEWFEKMGDAEIATHGDGGI